MIKKTILNSLAYFSKHIFGKEDNIESESDSNSPQNTQKQIEKKENFNCNNKTNLNPLNEQAKTDFEGNVKEEILKAENLGKIGINQYKTGKFEDSKVNLVNCCDILMKIRRITNCKILDEKINFYLMYAEECDKRIKEKLNIKSPLYSQKIPENPNICFKNNVQPNMDQNILAIIRDTIICNKPNISFKDIIGLSKEKDFFEENLIFPAMRPDLFKGIRSPVKGILMFGPPGNGKTQLAKAIATECQATFFNLSASTLVSKYMGESEKLMRGLFQYAALNQPSIIFIDEVDSILTSRGEGEHEASRRLKTEFLVQFDGLGSNDQNRLFVIAATNRPQEIDNAALRRFTKRIFIDLPKDESRQAMIKQLIKDISIHLEPSQLRELSNQLDGFSFSDIKAVVSEACKEPMREIKKNLILKIDQKNIRPVEIADFNKAIKNYVPSVKKKDLIIYKKFLTEK